MNVTFNPLSLLNESITPTPRYESWESCAIREVLEETGLDIQNVKFAHVTNDIMKDQNKHYITIFMIGECVPPPSFLGISMHPRPRNLEPHKCEGWESYSWEELCSMADGEGDENISNTKLFGPLLQLVKESPQSVLDFMNRS
jgi:8-oxo-dGTP diphosphatase